MKGTKNAKKIKVIVIAVISIILAIIAVAVAVIGVNYGQNRNFAETFYSVSSLKVNNKFRVIQISDLHNCTYGEKNAKLIDRVEKLDPDIIILTGDIIDDIGSGSEIAELCSSFARIAPSYYIFGNNEVEMYYLHPLTQEELDAHYDRMEEMELGKGEFFAMIVGAWMAFWPVLLIVAIIVLIPMLFFRVF